MHRRSCGRDQGRLIDETPIEPLAADDEVQFVAEIAVAAARPQMQPKRDEAERPARMVERRARRPRKARAHRISGSIRHIHICQQIGLGRGGSGTSRLDRALDQRRNLALDRIELCGFEQRRLTDPAAEVLQAVAFLA
jgi:hypothetical protein